MTNQGAIKRICFVSVDVEHDKGQEGKFRGVEELGKIIDIFKKYGIKATFFATGQVLEKYRDSARAWAKDYEIGCHTFTHRFWNTLNQKDRKKELDDFISLYQNIFGVKPKGFRAPSHVIDASGLKLLEEKGFLYDSSIVPHYPPFKKYRGYQGRKPRNVYFIGGLLESPVTGQIFGIPLAGAWIRGLPLWVYRALFLFYCPDFLTLNMHSWEASDVQFLKKLEEILKMLKNKNYQFFNGEQIYQNYK